MKNYTITVNGNVYDVTVEAVSYTHLFQRVVLRNAEKIVLMGFPQVKSYLAYVLLYHIAAKAVIVLSLIHIWRYLANIKDQGAIPSLPVMIQLIKICGLPVERYFNPEIMREESEQRQRVSHKLKLCPE